MVPPASRWGAGASKNGRFVNGIWLVLLNQMPLQKFGVFFKISVLFGEFTRVKVSERNDS